MLALRSSPRGSPGARWRSWRIGDIDAGRPSATTREQRMRAMVCREWGGPDSLRVEEVGPGPLGPREARIKVEACGVNFADTLMIAGKYQVKPPFPFTPGLEAAGIVSELGSGVGHLKVRQRVL